jgi:hypothetical protein
MAFQNSGLTEILLDPGSPITDATVAGDSSRQGLAVAAFIADTLPHRIGTTSTAVAAKRRLELTILMPCLNEVRVHSIVCHAPALTVGHRAPDRPSRSPSRDRTKDVNGKSAQTREPIDQ